MARYTLQRFVYMIITLFIIATLTFFLMKLLPGSPLQNQEKLTPEQKALILKEYGLDKPVPVQYIQYLGNLLKGDLGVSFQYDNRPVTELISDRIGPSAQLGFQAIVFGTIVGLILGIVAAIRHNHWEDYTATVIAVLGASIPSFVLGGFLAIFYRCETAMASGRLLGRLQIYDSPDIGAVCRGHRQHRPLYAHGNA